MSCRYTLRLKDGSDAGEVTLEQPATVGDSIQVSGGVRARVRAVVRVKIIEEFVENPHYGIFEIDWLDD